MPVDIDRIGTGLNVFLSHIPLYIRPDLYIFVVAWYEASKLLAIAGGVFGRIESGLQREAEGRKHYA